MLIGWHYGTLPNLVISLGAKPPYIHRPDEQFDRIWRIEHIGDKATIKDSPAAPHA